MSDLPEGQRPPRSSATLASLAVFAVLVGAGCGKSDGTEIAPASCLGGTDAYLTALQSAPDQVTLSDGARISQCLVPGQSGGELATIGTDLVAVATTLNERALSEPSGPWSEQAGYLLGAVEKAARSSNGIHTDLVRRVSGAAEYLPAGVKRSVLQPGFDRGLEAGMARG